MNKEEKDELLFDLNRRVKYTIILFGVPSMLAMGMAIFHILKDVNSNQNTTEVANKLMTNPGFIELVKGPPGPSYALPLNAHLLFSVHKPNGIIKNCNDICRESEYTGCVLSGLGVNFGTQVKLENAACNTNESGDVDCICF
ncbi:MAG: hypothetical protein PHT19_04515 [Methylococcus sp.]|nr:hypothetical protein [Methylococcus sp.]